MRLVKAAKASPHAKFYCLSTDCIYIITKSWWVEFEFNQFKKVLDSVGQIEYQNITQYMSKIKI